MLPSSEGEGSGPGAADPVLGPGPIRELAAGTRGISADVAQPDLRRPVEDPPTGTETGLRCVRSPFAIETHSYAENGTLDRAHSSGVAMPRPTVSLSSKPRLGDVMVASAPATSEMPTVTVSRREAQATRDGTNRTYLGTMGKGLSANSSPAADAPASSQAKTRLRPVMPAHISGVTGWPIQLVSDLLG
jgi:hypothetical protein